MRRFIYTADGDTAQVTTEGQSAVIRLQEQETLEGQQLHFSREGLLNLLREEMRSHHTIIIEVPKTVSITSGSQDGVYFDVGGGVEFVNFAQIREYGYLPTEEETLKTSTRSSRCSWRCCSKNFSSPRWKMNC